MLELRAVTKRFGGVLALNAVDLVVEQGEIVGVIGPNGAGKTTLFNVIAGSLPSDGGDVFYCGENVSRLSVPARVGRGIARTYQLGSIFEEFTVFENLVVACHLISRRNALGEVLTRRRGTGARIDAIDRATEIASLIGLGSVLYGVAGNLPYGQKKALTIGLALATGARCLLLDEPMAGMTQSDIRRTVGIVENLRADGLTAIVVEHNVGVVMRLCDRIAVLNFGVKIAEGPPSAIRVDADVIKAYLGTSLVESA